MFFSCTYMLSESVKELTASPQSTPIGFISQIFYVLSKSRKFFLIFKYCYAHLWKEREAYSKTLETTVYLTPESCHKGIGNLLMCRLIDECRSRGYHALIACITADNYSSLRMHESLGFRQVSRFHEAGLKFGRRLDIIDLELVL